MPSDIERIKAAIDSLPAMTGFLAHPEPESVFEVDAVKDIVITCWNMTSVLDDFYSLFGLTNTHTCPLNDELINYFRNGTSVVFTPEQVTLANEVVTLIQAVEADVLANPDIGTVLNDPTQYRVLFPLPPPDLSKEEV